MGKYYTDQERYEHCRKYRISGLSQSEYARINGINRNTFQDWCAAYRNIHGKFININQVSEKENTIIEEKDIRVNILSENEKIKKSSHFSRFDHSIVVIEYKELKVTASLENAEKILEKLYDYI